AGAVHYWLALGLLGLAGLHALGALKHHLIDKDNTLRRMLGMRLRNSTENGK
ncbi:MAG TPA: cytochrome B, partial [Pseudomonas sp.]|nr:cytochrome B [Pseudomonas sp.]